MKPTKQQLSEIGSYLAQQRWTNATEADRDQPREAGKLGGKKPTCHCGKCNPCKQRMWRKARIAKAGKA